MTRKVISVPIEVRLALTQFYEDYAAVVDSGNLDSWDSFFTQDCRYRVTARENHAAGLPHAAIFCQGIGMIRDRACAIRDSTYYSPRTVRHFLGGVRVTQMDDTGIHAHASFMVTESVSDMAPYILVVGEYIDHLVSGPNGYLLQDRTCVYDNYRIFNSLVYPV